MAKRKIRPAPGKLQGGQKRQRRKIRRLPFAGQNLFELQGKVAALVKFNSGDVGILANFFNKRIHHWLIKSRFPPIARKTNAEIYERVKRQLSGRKSHCWGVFRSGVLIGAMRFDLGYKKPTTAYWGTTYILPRFRYQTVGTRLYQEAEQFLIQQGMKDWVGATAWDNKNMVGLFKKAGGKQYHKSIKRKDEGVPRERPTKRVWFRKKLASS